MRRTARIMSTWDKARIPIRRMDHVFEQLEVLVQQWERLKKNRGRLTATQKANVEALKGSFNDLFDVAHQDALGMIKIISCDCTASSGRHEEAVRPALVSPRGAESSFLIKSLRFVNI